MFVSLCQVHFLFCLSLQYPPISPTCTSVLFCGLLYLLLVVCLSIFLLLFDASLLNFMCCGLLHILFVKLYVSLSFFFCLMRVSRASAHGRVDRVRTRPTSSLFFFLSSLEANGFARGLRLNTEETLFCIYYQRWYFCHLCALLIKLVFQSVRLDQFNSLFLVQFFLPIPCERAKTKQNCRKKTKMN